MFNLDWFTLAGLIMAVESGIGAVKKAQGVEAKATAVGQLTVVVLQGVEKLSGKDVVNDPKLQALVSDAIAAIADAKGVKP
jgi:hypothetical protein